GQGRWLGAGTLVERRVAERLSLSGSGRYWTVTPARLVALGEAAVALPQAGQELGKVDRPADADNPVGEDAVVVGVPVGVAEPPGRGEPKIIGDASDAPVPCSLAFRLAQLLRDRR